MNRSFLYDTSELCGQDIVRKKKPSHAVFLRPINVFTKKQNTKHDE
jgi:hypothetical protein